MQDLPIQPSKLAKTPQNYLELLAPAGTAELGIAAVDHGADAVYIGGPKFGARAAAGNTLKDIERLIRHAHRYYARVYLVLNTILSDRELEDAEALIKNVYEMEADAVILQDVGILELDLPPIPLIASTQMHSNTIDKVKFLEEVGFSRVILPRELSLEEISQIREQTTVELESFVHGALCVSYSGQCYLSEAVCGRSGNRGVCAQPCRSRYSLIDGNGKTVVKDKHLLSLKDLNLSLKIADLVTAGITSFKIEGRYKDINYVKNVTAAYRKILDDITDKVPHLEKSSSGRTELFFVPNLETTFNRGYTNYFAQGRSDKPGALDTPKSIGKQVGKIAEVQENFFRIKGEPLHNGDGLCYYTAQKTLSGFRVNKVEGQKIYPHPMPRLSVGVVLYRNHDKGFYRQLQQKTASRKISVDIIFEQGATEIRLKAIDENGIQATLIENLSFVKADQPERSREQIKKQLRKSGDTEFQIKSVTIEEKDPGFIRVSDLNRCRRALLDLLIQERIKHRPKMLRKNQPSVVSYPHQQLDYHANVYNSLAKKFYEKHGCSVVEPAFETMSSHKGKEVMTTRYCLKHQLDACPRFTQNPRQLKEPLILQDQHHQLTLEFDCKACLMKVYFEKED